MPTGVLTHLARLAGDFADLCYPRTCVNCDAPSDSPHLCAACDASLRALEQAPACDRCGAPVAAAGAPCPFCGGKGLPWVERVVRLGTYDDPLRGLIHKAKYRHRWPLAEVLADRLAGSERAKGLLTETRVLVPVPLHWVRHVVRGYNQSDVIARRIGRTYGIRVASPAVRLVGTHAQVHLHSRAEREDNLRRAFALVDAGAVRGKDVTIVDDVLTTGATARSLARALAKGRPAGISVLVLAVADPKGRGFEQV